MSITPTGGGGRRTFIKTVVLSTGAVFLDWNIRADAAPKDPNVITASLDYKAAHEFLRDGTKKIAASSSGVIKEWDVIVIGGGISGLAAAWKIQKSGKKVLVIDNEAAVGGGIRVDPSTGAELGAVRFTQTHGAAGELFADCGLAPMRIPEDGYWIDRGTILNDLYAETTLRQSAMAAGSPIAMRNFRNSALAMDPKPTFPLWSADPETITQYDMMEGDKIIAEYPGIELAEWLDVFTMGTFGRTLPKTSPYAFYASYMPQFGSMTDDAHYSFSGGLSALPTALAKKIGAENIRSGTLAVRVENLPGHERGVAVTCIGAKGQELMHAKAAVIAVQKHVANRLLGDVDSMLQFRMKNISMQPCVTVQLKCSARLMPKRSFTTWFRDPERRFTHIHDATYLRDLQAGTLDRTTGEFLYTIPCIPGDTSMKSLEEEAWLVRFAQMTVGAVSDYLYVARDVTTEVRIFAWGHAIASPSPGMIGQLFPKSSEPVGAIYFGASDNDICSTVDSAIGNGIHAADLALAHS